ncbi:MAG: hypothetical protein WBL44_09205 [Nitrososphaeraceae archaeon]
MESATTLTYVFATFVLIVMSITTATDGSMVQFPIADHARAAPDNELELNCEGNEGMCLVEACLGNECSALGKETKFSEMLTEELISKVPMKLADKDSCQTTDEKEEINNFKFRATKEGSDELNSNNDDGLGIPSQSPVARWDHSDSDILIGMDLGMIKKICNINLLFDDDAEIKDGFSVTVSNDSKSLHKVVDEFTTGTSPESWSSHDLDSLVGRFVHLTIPGVSEFYVDGDDDDDPIVSEILVKALPMTQTSRNSSAQSNSTDTHPRQMPNNTMAQPEGLSPLEFLDAGSDLLDTPILGAEPYRTNQSSLTDMSSTPTSNLYTGDIFLP